MTGAGPPPTAPRQDTPCFLVLAHDVSQREQAAGLREAHLDGHLAHVERHWRRYVTAGPIRPPRGGPIIGSSFLVLAADDADARALMDGDPYFACGLYERIEVYEQTLAVGLFIGGKIWESAQAVRDRKG